MHPWTSLWSTSPYSPSLSLPWAAAALWTSRWSSAGKTPVLQTLSLWGLKPDTQFCLLSATQMTIITSFDLQSALFLKQLSFTTTRTHCSFVFNLLSSRNLAPFFTKLLLGLLSQEINFAELHAASDMPLSNWNSSQIFPVVCGHIQTWESISTTSRLLMKILWGNSPYYGLLWDTTCKLDISNCNPEIFNLVKIMSSVSS